MPLTRTAAPSTRPDHLHIGRVHLEVTRNTDRPGQYALCEPPTKRRAQPITSISWEPVRVIVLTDFEENTLPRRLRFGVCFSTPIIGACPNENFVSRDLAISDCSDRLLGRSQSAHLPR
jgi:hypothetical protein